MKPMEKESTGEERNPVYEDPGTEAGKYGTSSIRNVNNIPVGITRREREVLRMICAQYTNAEIASRIHVSVRTVDGHRNSLLEKTGCRNTAGLVLFAVCKGLYDPQQHQWRC